MITATRCEVRYIDNLISIFKVETIAGKHLQVNCITASGKANHPIKVGIDVFGIAKIIQTLAKKEIRQNDVGLIAAKNHIEFWRTSCAKMGLFEQIEIDLDERGEWT